jgi:2-iminoacetate synthase
MVSFPRICPEAGGFAPPFEVDDIFLAQMIWAFRLCLPEVTLVLSTREGPAFRDGMAGVGINRMSAASRTTVGGYAAPVESGRQFDVKDGRNVEEVCGALRTRGLQPVFKNWDRVLR